ncbi:MAG TPA: transglutaminaseTgpA domain-containing protein [Vicinamibacteria bacterium]|nr:transglutaminaseTgpA domain-containing protein [Vicinamibacteria bacterium]
MKRVRPTAVRVAHAVALAGSTAALAFALALRPGGAVAVLLAALTLAALATPFLEWVAVPRVLAERMPRLLVRVLLLSALVAWLSRSMGMLVLDPAVVPLVTASLLVPMAIVFALAPGAFAPGRTLVPATIFLLALAGLDPAPRGYGASALFFVKDADHNAFAERYLPLAAVVLLALWAGALVGEGPRWRLRHAFGLAVSVALAVAVAATGVVGLPLLQPRVERAFASALDQGETGLSGEATLGEFAELAASRRRVLDLRSSPPSGASRLPSEVFTRFDGRRWTNPPPRPPAKKPKGAPTRPPVLRPTSPPAFVDGLVDGLGSWFLAPPSDPRAAVALRVDQADVGRWPLLLPRGPIAVTAQTPYLEKDRFGLLRRPPGWSLTLYGALLPATPIPPTAPAPLADDERDECLALPPHVDPRIVQLARTLALESPEPRGRLSASVQHLQTGYRYTLAPGAFRTSDPLAEFLFGKKAGYCEYFASAAVVLLRLQGVPARFVKGLSVGPQTDVGGGLHVVRESDAHAWIEAFVPGEGWVEEDPTPPGQFASARSPAGTFDRLVQRARAALAAAWNRLSVRGPAAFLAWLGREFVSLAGRAVREPLAWALVVLLGVGPRLIRLWRARRRRLREAARDGAPVVPADLRALVRDLERQWAATGRPRPAGRGLLEHARVLSTIDGPAGPLPAALRAAGREGIEAYYRARFGGEVPDPTETNRLRQALRA